MSDNYTPYFALELGLMTCNRCGSAVLSDATKDHNRWHDYLLANLELPFTGPLPSTEKESNDEPV